MIPLGFVSLFFLLVLPLVYGQSCNPGSYLSSSSNTCESCAPGSYSSGGTTASCTACPNNGTTTVAAPSAISDCLPGPTTTILFSSYELEYYPQVTDNNAIGNTGCATSCANDINCVAWSYNPQTTCYKFGQSFYTGLGMNYTSGILIDRITTPSLRSMVNSLIGTSTLCEPGWALINGKCLHCQSLSDGVCSGKGGPTSCSNGFVPNEGKTECIPEATSCSPGKYLTAGRCRDCMYGNNICPGGTSSYVACTSSLVSDPDRTTCVAAGSCTPGQYKDGSNGCRYCPKQYDRYVDYPYGEFQRLYSRVYDYCPGGTASFLRCSYSNGVQLYPSINQTTCVPGCDFGKYLDGGIPHTDENNVTFLEGGVCTDCPIGKACYGGLSPPTSCPTMTPGGFSWAPENSGTGSKRCKPTGCPPGYYMNNFTGVGLNYFEQNNFCMRCPPGYTCPGGMGAAATVYAIGATCAPGTFLNPGSDCAYSEGRPVCGWQQFYPPLTTPVGSCTSVCPIQAYCPGGGALPDYCDQSKGFTLSQDGTKCTKSSGGGGGGGGGGGCTGSMPQCTAPQYASCVNSAWTCISPPVCTGDTGACNGQRTCPANGPFLCNAFPTCAVGGFFATSLPTQSSTCYASPPAGGSTSCPAGQFLNITGSAPQTTWVFNCQPCPSGYTCAGGIGAVAISTTEVSTPSNCQAPTLAVPSAVTPGVFPFLVTKYRCYIRSFGTFNPPMGVVMSCPAGTFRIGINCMPCPTGANQCLGEFRTYSIIVGNNNNVAPSASSTPSNTPTPSSTASAAPPPEQDVLVPYLLSSSDLCASSNVASKFLDPSNGIAVNLRYSMGSSLGYSGSDAFVSGLVVCDGTYIPVDKDAPINTVNADQPFNGTVVSSDTPRRLRRLYDMLNSLSLPIDGTTVVVELGVAVPAILAPALTNLMVAMMTNASTAEIQALATNLTATMASPQFLAMYPVQQGPNTAVALPPSLAGVISTAASAGNVPSFTTALASVTTAALSPIIATFNISNISSTVFAEGIRGGQVITYSNNYNGGAAAPSDSGSSGNGALGALVLIPIALGVVFFIIWYRRRKENEKNSTKGKSLEDNFTDVATTNTAVDLGSTGGQNTDGIKVEFGPTGTTGTDFSSTNPMNNKSSGLAIRRTEVQVNTKKMNDDNNSSSV